ncbi:MAG TPA: ribulokinase, partial [Solirubrobacteraceae bacterium]|nr:ribulokinase [Solirubrobacteraceae bacterium]
GTLSGRALVVRASDGEELGSAETPYPHAVMSEELAATGAALPPNWALQDPDDYIEVLRGAVPGAVAAAGIDPGSVVGIATDFTACTMVPVLADGTPLSRLEAWRRHPHAWVKLWRHHAAQPQADRINELAAARGEPWLRRYGGRISSEWEFAKALELLEEDPACYAAMDRFVEAADWIVWQLCGAELRNACTAGYKGIYQDGSYPSEDYLAALNPGFARFAAEKLSPRLAQLGARAGSLSAQAAAWTGLREGIAVAVGNVDAHVTAPAAGVVEAGRMVAIMGTSTCHVMIGEELAEVPGMCGVVAGGIVPGMWGYEAGQSGVGDIFAWFVENAVPPAYHERASELGVSVHEYLAELGAALEVGEHGLVALDWWSGNRSVLVDHELTGALVGMTLATRAHEIYWALIEATAFGTRKIIDTFAAAGVPVREFIAAGGLLRNEPLMRCYADVIGMPISVIASDQGPALGSAMHAAVAAGAHEDIFAAARAMGRVRRNVYAPDAARASAYDGLYARYVQLHDFFGVSERELMRALQGMRERGAR